ncbi:hypothetical protein J1N35_004067 [Gossypium stocksii]|uniref:RING-type E3 ubiquitin transferase n=1 Tax=Gossypium stocksii TaxID=47602 RepID=A0A9D3WC36_9ROSI|nr:hypothetical protein J1N35_004067 [Gossypium stocksii]
MAMKPSIFLWLCTFQISFLCISFSVKSVPSVAHSYSDHCYSIVPEPIPKSEPPVYEFGPFGPSQSGFYYSDGDFRVVTANITRHTNLFSFYTTAVRQTDKDGVFMIEGSFELQGLLESVLYGSGSLQLSVPPRVPPAVADYSNPFILKLHDFWSGSSGELCMVGTGSALLKEGRRSSKKCLPGDGEIAKLPCSISLSAINCTGVLKRVRIFLKFDDNIKHSRHDKRFDPSTTLIGEGIWDDKKNQLHVLLCRFLDIENSWSNAHVGDCTTRLSLRFPTIWSIKETSTIMGQIWTNKTEDDSGYFENIVFRSTENHMHALPYLKYEYTEHYRVRNLCPEKKLGRNRRRRYPSPNSIGMKFNMLVESSEGRTGWGSANALTVNSQLYMHAGLSFASIRDDFSKPTRWEPQGRANISYRIDIKWHTPPKLTDEDNASVVPDEKIEITAEGIYDADTGGLCMIGCRKLVQLLGNASMDCSILLNFQFAPVKGLENGGYIRGEIKSIREKSDLLYFDHLDVSSVAYNREQARHTIWTMDLEIALVVISQTLVCLSVRSQLYHSKRQPNRLTFTSLVTLVILALGQLVPLVLNYEALFYHKNDQGTVLFQTGGWLEANEVIIRITSMVAFLLYFRILQQAFSSRSKDGNGKGLWFAEKMTLLVTLPLYVSGAIIVLLVDRANYKHDIVLLPISPVDYWQRSTLDDLKSFAGLISDGFLLPQILFNIFSNSRENALMPSFYIGTSLVRLLPHVYDLYCDHSYVEYKGTFIYANPAENFFSTVWDVIIPVGVLLFAAIIYLQQQFGGCCIVPKRFRWSESYENIPMVSES